MNKREELGCIIEDYQPIIVALTEINPKNGQKPSLGELDLENYTVFLNDPSKRGVALYIDSRLNAVPCDHLNNFGFEESTWCEFINIKLLLAHYKANTNY